MPSLIWFSSDEYRIEFADFFGDMKIVKFNLTELRLLLGYKKYSTTFLVNVVLLILGCGLGIPTLSQTPQVEAAEGPKLENTAQEKFFGAYIESSRRIRGDGLLWDHEVQVALPPSYYSSEKSYPVLWVTDGFYSFEETVKLVNGRLQRYIPEVIVVGVGVTPDSTSEWSRRRTYDFTVSKDKVGFDRGLGSDLYIEQEVVRRKQIAAAGIPQGEETGGAQKFLPFLVDQLRPTLAREYRMGNDHTLFGHSGGGYFCTYALLARPESFSKYICSSPNLYAGNFKLFEMEKDYAQEHDDLNATVFFGAGEAEINLESEIIPAWGIVSSMVRMVEILGLRKYPSLNLHVRIFPEEDHGTTLPLSLSWGLRTVWKDQMSNFDRY